MNNKTIHSFWIAGPLSEMNMLTVKSFVANGHKFILYTYDVPNAARDFEKFGLDNIPYEIKHAREILPESEIYYYKNMAGGNPAFKFGGFAERLKAEMLFQLGGWHVDLDVTCLQPFEGSNIEEQKSEFARPYDFNDEYVLRPHNKGGIVANIIKAPAGSEFARRYVEHTKTITAENTNWEASFKGLNQIVKDLELEKYILPANILGDDSNDFYRCLFEPNILPNPELKAIHWCNARQLSYCPGSFYESLLIKYNLI